MIRLIIWALVFYFVYRFIRGLAYLTVRRNNEPKQQPKKPTSKMAINQKDVVEAEFEEIKNPKE